MFWHFLCRDAAHLYFDNTNLSLRVTGRKMRAESIRSNDGPDDLDTAEIGDQSVTLFGYHGLWEDFPVSDVFHAMKRIRTFIPLVESYSSFASDLASFNPNEDGERLFTLLCYFLEGARRMLERSKVLPRNVKGKMKGIIGIQTGKGETGGEIMRHNIVKRKPRCSTRTTLSEIQDVFEASIKRFSDRMEGVKDACGYHLLCFLDLQGQPKNFRIPNRSALELFVKACFYSEYGEPGTKHAADVGK